ncbi:hypothetical protein NHQ30_006453 [Ciborinia camelliae]|nr:hypothetical protein NHQ30_006453 [Ciborinia camelliae]
MNSPAEQAAVNLVFTTKSELSNSDDGTVEHIICQWHASQTKNRHLHGSHCLNEAATHLKTALFNRRTEDGCIESINAALDAIPDDFRLWRTQYSATGAKSRKKAWNPKEYIRKNWLETWHKWANFNQEKDAILMQIKITGINEDRIAASTTSALSSDSESSSVEEDGDFEDFESVAPFADEDIAMRGLLLMDYNEDEQQSVPPNWDRYAEKIDTAKFDTSERVRPAVQPPKQLEIIPDLVSREKIHTLNKFHLEDVLNRGRGRRFHIENDVAKGILTQWIQNYETAVHALENQSVEEMISRYSRTMNIADESVSCTGINISTTRESNSGYLESWNPGTTEIRGLGEMILASGASEREEAEQTEYGFPISNSDILEVAVKYDGDTTSAISFSTNEGITFNLDGEPTYRSLYTTPVAQKGAISGATANATANIMANATANAPFFFRNNNSNYNSPYTPTNVPYIYARYPPSNTTYISPYSHRGGNDGGNASDYIGQRARDSRDNGTMK